MNDENDKVLCVFPIVEGDLCVNEIQHKFIKCLKNNGENPTYDFEVCELCIKNRIVEALLLIASALNEKPKTGDVHDGKQM